MSFEEGLYSWLTGNAAISDLVEIRVYPDALPQDPTLPAVVYRRISADVDVAHDGPIDLEKMRLRLHCYGATPKAARGVANTIKSELNGYRGVMGSVAIHGAFFITQSSDFEDVTGASRVPVDFTILYK